MSNPQIDIIPSHKIDQRKWNNCIQNSSSPLIYGYTYYLDYMADNWSGVVIDDYKAVMPVPWRKKYGITYVYDVPFIQQLGAFSKAEYKDDFFLLALVDNFKYGDYNFNYNNKALFIKSHTNYILDLSKDYTTIQSNYKSDLVKNINKAVKENIAYKISDHATAIELYKSLYAAKLANVRPRDFDNLKNLCDFLHGEGKVIVRKVVNANQQIIAAALLITDGKRLYNIANSVTPEGRKKEANHFLFDAIFRDFSGSGLIFDFEGSDIPGVKSFYKNFGVTDQRYYSIHFNKLPKLIRWMKD